MSESAASGQTTITRRLLLTGTFAGLMLILLLTLLVDRSIRTIWLADLDRDLETVAASALAGLPEGAKPDQAWADRIAEVAVVRVTVIDLSGVVLADTRQDPAQMDNHAGRDEVRAALTGVTGHATRTSISTGDRERYVALPPNDGLIVRVSTSTSVIEAELSQTRASIIRVALVVAVVAIGALVLMGRRAARPIIALADHAQATARGERKVVPTRSNVVELDRLSLALATISQDLGGRVEEAEQASSLLEVVLGAIPQGTVLFDGGDRVVYTNPAAVRILGRVPDTLSGLAPFQFQMAVRQAREEAATVVRETDHGVPPRRLRGVATPFVDDPRILLVVVDITERERVDSIRRDFVANASHELKTPVATIIASSEALQIALSKGDQKAEKFASRIEDSARQLERLVSDLLDLSRLEKETREITPVRLDRVVAEEIERVRDRVADNQLTLVSDGVAVSVLGSRSDLGLAVRNLLDNAIRYTPGGGSIEVSVGREGDRATLRVSDTGEGIPSKDAGRVFERFYRVDSARSRSTGGTGLGLAIVRHVADTHGGGVSVDSELGRGSVFTVWLPLLESESPADN